MEQSINLKISKKFSDKLSSLNLSTDEILGFNIDYIVKNDSKLLNLNNTSQELDDLYYSLNTEFKSHVARVCDPVKITHISGGIYKLEFNSQFYNLSYFGIVINYTTQSSDKFGYPAFYSGNIKNDHLVTDPTIPTLVIYINLGTENEGKLKVTDQLINYGITSPKLSLTNLELNSLNANKFELDKSVPSNLIYFSYLNSIAQSLPNYKNGSYLDPGNKLVHLKVLGETPYDYNSLIIEIIKNLKSGLGNYYNVEDNLISHSIHNALSANMGRVLNQDKLSLGDWVDWSQVDPGVVPQLQKPISLRNFYEDIMKILDSKSVSRIQKIKGTDISAGFVLHELLPNEWRGIASLTMSLINDQNTYVHGINGDLIKLKIDETKIYFDTTNIVGNTEFDATLLSDDYVGYVSLVLDKDLLELRGNLPIINLNDVSIIGRVSSDLDVTVSGTVKISSGTYDPNSFKINHQIDVTDSQGITLVSQPVLGTPDQYDVSTISFKVRLPNFDQNYSLKVKIGSLFNGSVLESSIEVVNLFVHEIIIPDLDDVTIDVNYDSMDSNYGKQLNLSALSSKVDFIPVRVKFESVIDSTKVTQTNSAVSAGSEVNIPNYLTITTPEMTTGGHFSKSFNYRLADNLSINQVPANFSELLTANLNFKDAYRYLRFTSPSTTVMVTQGPTNDGSYLVNPVTSYSNPIESDSNQVKTLVFNLIMGNNGEANFSQYFSVTQGGVVDFDYSMIKDFFVNQVTPIKEFKFKLRVSALDSNNQLIYYKGNALVADKEFVIQSKTSVEFKLVALDQSNNLITNSGSITYEAINAGTNDVESQGSRFRISLSKIVDPNKLIKGIKIQEFTGNSWVDVGYVNSADRFISTVDPNLSSNLISSVPGWGSINPNFNPNLLINNVIPILGKFNGGLNPVIDYKDYIEPSITYTTRLRLVGQLSDFTEITSNELVINNTIQYREVYSPLMATDVNSHRRVKSNMSVGNTMFMSDYYRTVYKFSKSSNTPIPNDHSNQLVLTFDAKGDHNFPFLFELEYGSLLGSGVFGDYYHEAPSENDPYYQILTTDSPNSTYDQTTGLFTNYINLGNSNDIVNKALLGIKLISDRKFSFPIKLRLRDIITKNYNGNKQTIIRDNPNLMSDYLFVNRLEIVPSLSGLCNQEPSLYKVFRREPGTDVWSKYGSTVCLSSTSFREEKLNGQAYNAYAVDTNGKRYFMDDWMTRHLSVSGGGGGGCPTPEMMIRVSDNSYEKAGDLAIGDFIYTKPENSNEYGYYEVISNQLSKQPVYKYTFDDGTELEVSESHRFYISNLDSYLRYDQIGSEDLIDGRSIVNRVYLGEMDVVKFEIDIAHTYEVNGIMSHNNKVPEEPYIQSP